MKHNCTRGLIQVDRWNATVECERNEPGGVLCLGCAERDDVIRELADALWEAARLAGLDDHGEHDVGLCATCQRWAQGRAALARVDAYRATSEQEADDA